MLLLEDNHRNYTGSIVFFNETRKVEEDGIA
jgi:hypothetical protein